MNIRTRLRAATEVSALATVAAIVLVVAATPAHAAVTNTLLPDQRLLSSASASGDTVGVTCDGGSIAVNHAVVAPATSCSWLVETQVSATGPGVQTVNLTGVTPAAFPADHVTTVNTKDDAGGDVVNGSPGRDLVTADGLDTVITGAGDDYIDGGGAAVDAGDGDDVVLNADNVQAGPGDDRVYATGTIDGGTGDDTVVFDQVDNFVSVAGSYTIVPGQMTAAGPGSSEKLLAPNFENWELDLPPLVPGGYLTVDATAITGRVTINGSDGTFRTGAGTDVIRVGAGNDVINPGAGSDTVGAGAGDDTVTVRDGAADIVDCGPGTDTVVADPQDVVVNCETVSLLPPETAAIVMVGPKKVEKGQKVWFLLGQRAQDYVGIGFDARIDKGPFKPCANPFQLSTKKLKLGKHTLSVRAVYPGGNVDPTPETLKFKVVPRSK